MSDNDREFEEQLQFESDAARRLIEADGSQRGELYRAMYDEIYRRSLPRRGKTAADQRFGSVPEMLPILLRLADHSSHVLEIGCGCGFLCIELARRGRRVTGIDVSSVAIEKAAEHASELEPSARPEFLVGNAVDVLPSGRDFDLVFLVEVLEHLHELDVRPLLRRAYELLKPGGFLWLQTPNRLLEISPRERFNLEAANHKQDADAHLKEWTYAELIPLLREIGFHGLASFWQRPSIGFFPKIPASAKMFMESVLRNLPPGRVRRFLMYQTRVGEISIVARKPS